jgi:hypothetical protein
MMKGLTAPKIKIPRKRIKFNIRGREITREIDCLENLSIFHSVHFTVQNGERGLLWGLSRCHNESLGIFVLKDISSGLKVTYHTMRVRSDAMNRVFGKPSNSKIS